MICRIADLTVSVPEVGGMAQRCREYLTDCQAPIDIEIRVEDYEPHRWPTLTYDHMCYMESGEWFYTHLLRFGGMMLHASAVEYEGKAYLFSGPSGVGKSTHKNLWLQTLGEQVRVLNDDKPALRFVDGKWYVYGTPWCGKDGINLNDRAPLAGICFLKQGEENRIRRLERGEAISMLMFQTLRHFYRAYYMDLLLGHIGSIVENVPIFELENVPGPEAAQLSYGTMSQA